MGNSESSSLDVAWRSKFSTEEQTFLSVIFDSISGSDTAEETKDGKAPQKQFTLAMLKAYVHTAAGGSMVIRFYNGMRSIPIKKSSVADSISKKQFLSFLYYTMRGSAEERSSIIHRMISVDPDGPVTRRQVKEFIEDMIVSVIHLLQHEKMLKGWNVEKTGDYNLGITRLTAYLMSELKAEGEDLSAEKLHAVEFGQSELKDWVYRVSHIPNFLHALIALALHLTKPQYHGEFFSATQVLPQCLGIKYTGVFTVLDIPSVIYLKSNLPSENQSQWKLLFSSQAHGESFSRFSVQILHKGPTLLIVKDSFGYIFGGFASCSWELKPQFQGDSKCFLFTLSPHLGTFNSTGYNDHFMYLNHGQQTMPNGLGMGGQHSYFGLWIDSNYGQGHSKAKPRCTTYSSPQLSAKEHFTVDTLEVWMVGNPPKNDLSKTKSVLDTDPEARALLEMVGKTRVSDGLRDPGGVDEEE
ncbi:MTOR-associated protein MEAK7 isoform X2 [Narcine bancroftii]|uniref:MTOR-associated protein MEAK7 isoform X2 n=1 Tax=Narcine bancroftii TaxID=1343680 RepID=UPI0038314DC5